jgi:hypothetical protein
MLPDNEVEAVTFEKNQAFTETDALALIADSLEYSLHVYAEMKDDLKSAS